MIAKTHPDFPSDVCLLLTTLKAQLTLMDATGNSTTLGARKQLQSDASSVVFGARSGRMRGFDARKSRIFSVMDVLTFLSDETPMKDRIIYSVTIPFPGLDQPKA